MPSVEQDRGRPEAAKRTLSKIRRMRKVASELRELYFQGSQLPAEDREKKVQEILERVRRDCLNKGNIDRFRELESVRLLFQNGEITAVEILQAVAGNTVRDRIFGRISQIFSKTKNS